MKLLAIETVTDACSAALLIDGEINSMYEIAPRQHTQRILPMIEELLAAAELAPSSLDGLAFGAGPGSFTGVRIGAAVIQGLALAHDLPVIPISSLAALAARAVDLPEPVTIVPMLDARRKEVYCGHYRYDSNGLLTALEPDKVIMPSTYDFTAPSEPILGVGNGWAAFRSLVGDERMPAIPVDSQIDFPHAGEVARLAQTRYALGEIFAPEHAEPIYLRAAI